MLTKGGRLKHKCQIDARHGNVSIYNSMFSEWEKYLLKMIIVMTIRPMTRMDYMTRNFQYHWTKWTQDIKDTEWLTSSWSGSTQSVLSSRVKAKIFSFLLIWDKNLSSHTSWQVAKPPWICPWILKTCKKQNNFVFKCSIGKVNLFG